MNNIVNDELETGLTLGFIASILYDCQHDFVFHLRYVMPYLHKEPRTIL